MNGAKTLHKLFQSPIHKIKSKLKVIENVFLEVFNRKLKMNGRGRHWKNANVCFACDE